VPPEHIHEMPDVIAALEAVLDHFLAPGAKVIVPTPAYMPFLKVPALHGRVIQEVGMLRDGTGRYRYDLAALEAAFDDGGELLLLCNPHNPTGQVMTRPELEEIAELVERKGGRVFSDEIWMPLVLDGQHIPYDSLSEATARHTLTDVAASMAYDVTGLCCAHERTTNEADREPYAEVGHASLHGAANLGISATSTAYDEGEGWLGDILAYLRRNRDTVASMVRELLPRARLTAMEGTYVAWLDLREYGITGSLHDHLLELGRASC